jgi:plasmid stabilization system protein ParE
VKYSVRLLPELVDDAHEAFVWYETAATGLGHEFLRSYFIALASVQRQPLLHRKVYQRFRRILLERFPYVLYFQVDQDSIVILLLIHGARDPVLIRRSLRNRKESGN